MAIHKITMFFEQGDRGWTETFYRNNTDPIDACESTRLSFATILGPRSSSCYWSFVRATDVTVPRRFFLLPVNKVGVRPAQNGDESVTIAALFKIVGTTPQNAVRHIWIRGLTDEDVSLAQPQDRPDPSAGLVAALNTYSQLMANPANPWLIQAKPVALAPNQWRQVQTVQANVTLPTAQSDIIPFDTGTLPAVGSVVYFKGVQALQLPGLRGNFVVSKSTAATSFTIGYRYKNNIPTVSPATMYWRSATPVYIPVLRTDFEGFSSRDTGRPFDVPRGAKRPVRLRG